MFGPRGWINKHGFRGGPQLPANVANKLNGVSIDMMRKQGMIPEQGRANIKGLRGRLNVLGILGPLLDLLPDILTDIDRALRARQNGKSFWEQQREDLKDLETIPGLFGQPVPNPFYRCEA